MHRAPHPKQERECPRAGCVVLPRLWSLSLHPRQGEMPSCFWRGHSCPPDPGSARIVPGRRMVPTERVHGRGMYSGWARSGPKAGHTLLSVAGLHAAPRQECIVALKNATEVERTPRKQTFPVVQRVCECWSLSCVSPHGHRSNVPTCAPQELPSPATAAELRRVVDFFLMEVSKRY